MNRPSTRIQDKQHPTEWRTSSLETEREKFSEARQNEQENKALHSCQFVSMQSEDIERRLEKDQIVQLEKQRKLLTEENEARSFGHKNEIFPSRSNREQSESSEDENATDFERTLVADKQRNDKNKETVDRLVTPPFNVNQTADQWNSDRRRTAERSSPGKSLKEQRKERSSQIKKGRRYGRKSDHSSSSNSSRSRSRSYERRYRRRSRSNSRSRSRTRMRYRRRRSRSGSRPRRRKRRSRTLSRDRSTRRYKSRSKSRSPSRERKSLRRYSTSSSESH